MPNISKKTFAVFNLCYNGIMAEAAKKITARHIWLNVRAFLGHYGGGLINRADDHHIFLLAGGLSFSIFVCIIPLMLIVFSVLGAFVAKPSVTHEIELFIERVIPYQDYAATIKEIVFLRLNEFSQMRTQAGWIGAIGLLFAATGLFSSMRTILNTIYRVQNAGSVLIGKLQDLGMVLVVIIFFLLSLTTIPVLGFIEGMAERSEFFANIDFGAVESSALPAISFVIILFSFYLLYTSIPRKRPSQTAILISAVSAALLWHIAEELFGFYISHVFTLQKLYGTYTFLIVVAFWVYYTAIVFILGAEIGQLYRERQVARDKARVEEYPRLGRF